MRHQIIVGNLGTVLDTNNGFDAQKTYNEYVALSKANYGRVAGEPVTWFMDGEVRKEYAGMLEE